MLEPRQFLAAGASTIIGSPFSNSNDSKLIRQP